MRSVLKLLAILSVLGLLLLAGCSKGSSLSAVLQQNGISDKSSTGMKAEIRFLKESKGANYKAVDVSANASFLSQLTGFIQNSKPAEPPAGQYSPELKSDYEIVFSDSNNKSISLYYVSGDNYLIYPQSTTDKNGETLKYLYFTPDIKINELVNGQKKNAKLQESTDVKPARSMEELKTSIDPDSLAEAGNDVSFEFFSDSPPAYSGTACRIYTHEEVPAVPADSYLIVAYGKSKTGQQEKLSITKMEANDGYTKVVVEEPDDSLGVDAGTDAPQSSAVVVKASAIDPTKWIVFVNDDSDVLDIILPEDIAVVTVSAQPSATGVSPSPSATEDLPEGGGDEGSGDGVDDADAGAD